MKKNICLLIYDLRSGGAERVLSQWSFLLSDDFNVYMTLYDRDAEIAYPYSGKLIYLEGKANNKNIVTKVITVLKRAKSLADFVKKNDIDVVISFCNECNLANTISHHKAVKVCSIRSASDLNSNVFVNRVVYSKNNRIIIQTEALKETMISHYGDRIKNKLFVYGNPFDCESIRKFAVKEPPMELRNLLENKKTVVSVASFKPQKNHANLLRSFEILAEKMDDVYLLLVGADSTGRKAKVVEMTEKSKYRDRIIFVGELKNPYAVMSRATLFVLPSLAEGIPNVLAEAMICGTPVIASNCPTGPVELLCEDSTKVCFDNMGYYMGDYGVLMHPFSGPCEYNYEEKTKENIDFAFAMEKVLKAPDLLETLTKKAICGADKFDITRYKKELIDLIYSFL